MEERIWLFIHSPNNAVVALHTQHLLDSDANMSKGEKTQHSVMSFYRKLVLSLMLGEAGPRAVAFAQLALAFRLSWFPLTAASRRDLRWGDDAMRDLGGWKVIQSTEIFVSTQSLRPSACASSLSLICFWCFRLCSVVYVCNVSICWCAFILDVLLCVPLVGDVISN